MDGSLHYSQSRYSDDLFGGLFDILFNTINLQLLSNKTYLTQNNRAIDVIPN